MLFVSNNLLFYTYKKTHAMFKILIRVFFSQLNRYYYKREILLPMSERLVYKFGPKAEHWRCDDPNFGHKFCTANWQNIMLELVQSIDILSKTHDWSQTRMLSLIMNWPSHKESQSWWLPQRRLKMINKQPALMHSMEFIPTKFEIILLALMLFLKFGSCSMLSLSFCSSSSWYIKPFNNNFCINSSRHWTFMLILFLPESSYLHSTSFKF
jgi:hypothetical protein